MSDFTRGSEWRKWDLHFHTPSSYDYRDKNITNKQIIDELYKNEIVVVAITDHHIIDVERIQELQKLGKERGITVLPGIEFCSELGGSESIHFIGIFAENSDIETIWTKIQGKHNLTKGDIEKKGNERIVCKFENTCKTIAKLGGIVSVHAGSKTNSIESIKSNLLVKQETKTEYLSNYISILEVGKFEDENTYREKVFPSIGFKLPIIICSDNHDIKNYSLKENCWIKADPTFEGLKQIIYEPEERVRIQEGNPEDKLSYQVIDRIEILHNDFIETKEEAITNEQGEEQMESVPVEKIIYLNPYLNTIIGGRSTGKSILLGAIAKKLNSDKRVKDNSEYENYINEIVSNMRIFWKDGIENNERDIEYFPQSHMYQLAKTPKDFDSLVENIIKQDTNRKNLLDNYKIFERNNNNEIIQKINTLFETKNKINDFEKQKKEIGDKEGITTELNKLSQELDNLKAKIQITEDELNKYNEFKKEYDENINSIAELEKQKEVIDLLKTISLINENIKYDFTKLNNEFKGKIENIFRDVTQKTLKYWNEQIDSTLLDINSRINSIKEKNTTIENEAEYKKGKIAFDNNRQYKEIENKYKIEANKLRAINDLKKQQSENETIFNELKPSIIEKVKSYYTELQNIQNNLSVETEKLKIIANINIDIDKYKNILSRSINQQSYEGQSIVNKGINDIDILFTTISDLFEKLLSNSITLKRGYNNENLIKELLPTNFLNISYEIDMMQIISSLCQKGKRLLLFLCYYWSSVRKNVQY